MAKPVYGDRPTQYASETNDNNIDPTISTNIPLNMSWRVKNVISRIARKTHEKSNVILEKALKMYEESL